MELDAKKWLIPFGINAAFCIGHAAFQMPGRATLFGFIAVFALARYIIISVLAQDK